MSRNMNGKNDEIRKEKAAERALDYKKLSNAQKIEVLDKRLGVGVGAVAERARLAGKATVALNDVSKDMPQEGLTKDVSPKKKYARKYSGKDITK